jgi:hypothetical protein
MPLIARENSSASIAPINPGVYVAVCYGVIDLGTHHNPIYENDAHKILVQWELPEVRGDFERDGQQVSLPRAISKRYTLSLSEKASLRRDLESWRGRKFAAQELSGFDLRAILGAPCQLQIVHETSKEGRVFATIAAIMALPKGTPRPKPENPTLFFSFEDAGDRPVLPSGLPEWVAKTVLESREWKASLSANSRTTLMSNHDLVPAGAGVEADNVPF